MLKWLSLKGKIESLESGNASLNRKIQSLEDKNTQLEADMERCIKGDVNEILRMTQAEYDALDEKKSGTIYMTTKG